MPCYHPLKGWRSKKPSINGKYPIVFNIHEGYADMPMEVPCGQCIGCRIERSRQWAVRCMHEASLYSDSCFVTLTYDDENLPDDGSLHLEHFQKFMKRLRKHFHPVLVRFFHCGEYGDLKSRPHYHVLLFGIDFTDKVKYQDTPTGDVLYTSDTLAGLWPYGMHQIGAVTYESAAYVARYVTKKVTGRMADKVNDAGLTYYERLDPYTGEVVSLKPEYCTMSRRPGIGKGWFDKYHSDVYPSDEVIVNGKPFLPPKFYDSQYEILDSRSFHQVKHDRVLNGKKFAENRTGDRLEVREKVKQSRLSNLKRPFEG